MHLFLLILDDEKFGNYERVTDEDANDEGLICSVPGIKRHPKDCSMFYRCVKYDNQNDSMIKFQYRCPQGLLFDDTHKICNWPSWSPPCTGSGEILPITKKTFNCPTYGYFQDPENCEYFHYCSDFGRKHFQGFEFKCPFGLGFDEEKLLCNWKWLVKGCKITEADSKNANNQNIDALLQNLPSSSYLPNGDDNSNEMVKNIDPLDELMSRSDKVISSHVGGGGGGGDDYVHEGEVHFVDGQIPAEHRQLEFEPKSRRSFARAIKEQVSGLVGSVTNKVKNLFSPEDATERRDHVGGGLLPEWFSHLNPFAASSIELPVRFEEMKPDRRPLIHSDSPPSLPHPHPHHLPEPMISIPMLNIPTTRNKNANKNHNNKNSLKDGDNEKRPKKSAFRPQVHYAKPEPDDDGKVKTFANEQLISALTGGKNKHEPDMIAVPILTLKDQTIQRRPDTGLPPSNDRPKSNQRLKPDEHHEVLNVASSIHRP